MSSSNLAQGGGHGGGSLQHGRLTLILTLTLSLILSVTLTLTLTLTLTPTPTLTLTRYAARQSTAMYAHAVARALLASTAQG